VGNLEESTAAVLHATATLARSRTLATILSLLSFSLDSLLLTSSRACRARELPLRGAPSVSQGRKTKRRSNGGLRERVEELERARGRESGRSDEEKEIRFFLLILPYQEAPWRISILQGFHRGVARLHAESEPESERGMKTTWGLDDGGLLPFASAAAAAASLHPAGSSPPPSPSFPSSCCCRPPSPSSWTTSASTSSYPG
jgi:hypothetical protein